jgi:hypothetical protein
MGFHECAISGGIPPAKNLEDATMEVDADPVFSDVAASEDE